MTATRTTGFSRARNRLAAKGQRAVNMAGLHTSDLITVENIQVMLKNKSYKMRTE